MEAVYGEPDDPAPPLGVMVFVNTVDNERTGVRDIVNCGERNERQSEQGERRNDKGFFHKISDG